MQLTSIATSNEAPSNRTTRHNCSPFESDCFACTPLLEELAISAELTLAPGSDSAETMIAIMQQRCPGRKFLIV